MSDFSDGDTLKLVLFSDSHGNVANMADVVRLEHPDRVLHMGDLARDAEELARQFPDIPVTYVPGNCDGRRPDLPDERRFTLEGCKILMTHGHTYHVKAGPGRPYGRPGRRGRGSCALATPMRRSVSSRTACGSSTPAPPGAWFSPPTPWLSWRRAARCAICRISEKGEEQYAAGH